MRFCAPPVALAAIILAAPSPAAASFSHVVAPGESLSSVAASDGLSVEALAAANGLSPEAPLIAGSTLAIPASGESTEAQLGSDEAPAAGTPDEAAPEAQAAASGASEGGAYLVQPGDTLTQIAARAGTSVEALAALNGLDPEALLASGAELRLPGGAGEGAAAPEAVEGPPYPTEETVAPSEVGAIASEHGVPPSLAEAVAQQESGFDNALTSSADARGVMQILPGTWSWISQNLAGPPPLEPASVASNVRGGVLFLQYLLKETEGDPALAAAGYFQGLESVRSEGEYPETEQYVESVLAQQSQFGGE